MTYSPDGAHYSFADRSELWHPPCGSYCSEAAPCLCCTVVSVKVEPPVQEEAELVDGEEPGEPWGSSTWPRSYGAPLKYAEQEVRHVSDGDTGTSGESSG